MTGYSFSAAERRTFTDETSSDEVALRSRVMLKENLPNKVSLMDSQGDRSKRTDKKLSYPAFQKYKDRIKGENKRVVGEKGKTSKINLPNLAAFVNVSKTRIVNCFVKKEEKPKSSARTRSIRRKEKKKRVLAKVVETTVTAREDLETKQTLREIFFQVLHLIIITAIALGMMSSSKYYFTNITASLFLNTKSTPAVDPNANEKEMEPKTLKELKTVEDFWAFAESTLLDLLYSKFFNPQNIPDDKNSENEFYENQILGVARLRQVRVKKDSCEIHPYFERYFNSCYNYYSIFSEDTNPIKPNMEATSTATAWVYSEAKSLGTSYYYGETSIYGGGGYYLDLPPNKKDALEMIKELKKNTWVSIATRAVFIDFNLYNANVNLFCLCKIVLEFLPVGGMIPKADFHSLKLIRYLTVLDFFLLACEIVYSFFAVCYTYELFKSMIRQGCTFFTFFWNCIDTLILALIYTFIILTVVRFIYVNALLNELQDRYNKYTEFQAVKELQINYNNIIAILIFFCWIKLLKYSNLNKEMQEFRKTLAKSFKDILWFLPIFLISLFAFAILGNLLFGDQIKNFKTAWSSFVTLLLVFLGNFNFKDIMESNKILGPLFLMSFVFFISLTLLNIFIAIVLNAYASVKSQIILSKPLTGEYIRRGFLNFFTCWTISLKKKSTQKAVKKEYLFKEIEKALTRAGFSTYEIKIFFYKYNINTANFLDQSIKTKIKEDLDLRPLHLVDTSEQVQINSLKNKIDVLRERMEDLEMNLVPVIDKVDILLQQF